MIKKISVFAVLLLVGGLLLTIPTVKVQASNSGPQCSDEVNNDDDGLIDIADPQCHIDGDASNIGSYDAFIEQESDSSAPCNSCGPVTPVSENHGGGGATYHCSDRLDNDGDMVFDQADPGCHTDGDANNKDSYNPKGTSEINAIPKVLGATTTVCGGTTGRPCMLQKTGGVAFNRYLANAKARKVAKKEKNSLEISKLKINQPVLDITNPDSLFREARILPWTSTPDKGSNTVLVGHAYYSRNGNFSKSTFYELDTMAKGDEITMTWKGVKYTYVVTEVKKVTPEHIEIEDPTTEPTLTIYTCGRFTNVIRNVVVATLKK